MNKSKGNVDNVIGEDVFGVGVGNDFKQMSECEPAISPAPLQARQGLPTESFRFCLRQDSIDPWSAGLKHDDLEVDHRSCGFRNVCWFENQLEFYDGNGTTTADDIQEMQLSLFPRRNDQGRLQIITTAASNNSDGGRVLWIDEPAYLSQRYDQAGLGHLIMESYLPILSLISSFEGSRAAVHHGNRVIVFKDRCGDGTNPQLHLESTARRCRRFDQSWIPILSNYPPVETQPGQRICFRQLIAGVGALGPWSSQSVSFSPLNTFQWQHFAEVAHSRFCLRSRLMIPLQTRFSHQAPSWRPTLTFVGKPAGHERNVVDPRGVTLMLRDWAQESNVNFKSLVVGKGVTLRQQLDLMSRTQFLVTFGGTTASTLLAFLPAGALAIIIPQCGIKMPTTARFNEKIYPYFSQCRQEEWGFMATTHVSWVRQYMYSVNVWEDGVFTLKGVDIRVDRLRMFSLLDRAMKDWRQIHRYMSTDHQPVL